MVFMALAILASSQDKSVCVIPSAFCPLNYLLASRLSGTSCYLLDSINDQLDTLDCSNVAIAMLFLCALIAHALYTLSRSQRILASQRVFLSRHP